MPGTEHRTRFWLSEYDSEWDIYQHGVTRVLAHKITDYQEMYIVEAGRNGTALVLDGNWQSCTGDEFLYHEPLVQPAMLQHGSPHRVLVLGGGEGATLREALRWKTVEQAVMVDIDGQVVESCKEHLAEMHQGAFDDPRVELVIGDAVDYLDSTDTTWDVVICDLSDPIEDGPSFKLFTKEYFEKVARILAADGAMGIQAGPVGPADLQTHARLIHTLATVFEHVCSYATHLPTFASPWGLALASNRPIDQAPNPSDIDATLKGKTRGGLRMFDGRTLLGMLQPPLHVREAIRREKKIFTLEQPAKYPGRGMLVKDI